MIGKVISSLLKDNASLLLLVDTDSIFPYVINEDTVLPAIVYTIDSIDPNYTKEGWSGDNIGFSVVSFSTNYSNLQDIAAQVRVALELMSGTTEGITYFDILVEGQSEGYNITEDVYLNKLTFSVEVTDY